MNVEQNTLRWISAERLTTGSGADANVAISRDDRRLVFTTEQHASRVWAFPFDASAGAIVGHGTPVTPEQDVITWSALAPDGSKVAYVRAGSRQSDLWAVNIDGSQRELLAQNALGGQCAPNGKAIAYSLFRIESGEWALATLRSVARRGCYHPGAETQRS